MPRARARGVGFVAIYERTLTTLTRRAEHTSYDRSYERLPFAFFLPPLAAGVLSPSIEPPQISRRAALLLYHPHALEMEGHVP